MAKGRLKKGYAREIVDLLQAGGAEDIHIKAGRSKHTKILFTAAGKKQICVIPTSPSDPRGRLNAIAMIRRQLRGEDR